MAVVFSLRCAKGCFFILIATVLVRFIGCAGATPTPIGDWKAQPVSHNVDASPPFDPAGNDAICKPDAAASTYFVFDVGPPSAVDGGDYGLTVTTMLAHLSSLHYAGVAVNFAAGIYEMKTPIIVPSRTCIMGAGSGMNGTTLYATQNMGGALIRAEITTHIAVSGISIEPNVGYNLGYGIWCTLCNYFFVRDVRVTRVKYDGVRVEGSGARWAYHTTLSEVSVFDTGRYGIVVSQATNTHMTNISVGNVRKYAVLMTAGDKNTYLSDATLVGAEIGVVMKQGRGQEGPRGVRMNHVAVSGATKAGVWIKRTRNVRLTDVDIAGGDICYRINQSSMEKIGGNCTAKRQTVGTPYALPIPMPTPMPSPEPISDA